MSKVLRVLTPIKFVFSTVLLLVFSTIIVNGQLPNRQIDVVLTARPRKSSFTVGEPILVDLEIKNKLKAAISIQAYSSSPNNWNGEAFNVELPDIYRLPKIGQIWRKRPEISTPKFSAAPGGYYIRPGESRIQTIDIGKWDVDGGWVRGKYRVLVRINRIDVDKHTWIATHSEPIVIEII